MSDSDNDFSEEVITTEQVESPCHSSNMPSLSSPKDCEILLKFDLSAEQKLDIVLSFPKYNPAATYKFPTKVEYGKNRSFQHRYLQSFSWLGYSIQQDGCLCLPCCLFSSVHDRPQSFVRKPFCNWTKLNDRVKVHSTSSFHLVLWRWKVLKMFILVCNPLLILHLISTDKNYMM